MGDGTKLRGGVDVRAAAAFRVAGTHAHGCNARVDVAVDFEADLGWEGEEGGGSLRD